LGAPVITNVPLQLLLPGVAAVRAPVIAAPPPAPATPQVCALCECSLSGKRFRRRGLCRSCYRKLCAANLPMPIAGTPGPRRLSHYQRARRTIAAWPLEVRAAYGQALRDAEADRVEATTRAMEAP